MDLRSIFAGITGARGEAGADVPGQTALALRVRTAVERLPTDQRLLLTLADLEGCPLAEVAGILELPIGTVASRLGRARAAMRAMLADLPAAAEGPVAAGGQTAQRLRDRGVVVRLLPGAAEASSAGDRLVQRLQQGWTFLPD